MILMIILPGEMMFITKSFNIYQIRPCSVR